MTIIDPNAYFSLSGVARTNMADSGQAYQTGAEAIAWYQQNGLPVPTGIDPNGYYQLSPTAGAAAASNPNFALYDSGQQVINYNNANGIPTLAPTQTPGPPGTTGIGGTPGVGGLTSTQSDAWSQLSQTLQLYGFTGQDLTNLVAFAKGEIVSGNSQTQVLLDLQQTPEFQARFPAISQLSKQGVAITPAEYIATEQSYAQLEQAAGLPANYASYDQLIGSQVSPSEYADRINKGYLAVETAPPETIKAMNDYYGVSKGDLAAYFLDPTKGAPLLLQKAQAAQIGGASATSGFGDIGRDQAMRLAQMGVTYGQAQQGFQHLSTERQLFNPLPGAGHVGNTPTADQLLEAQFGSDGQTQLELQLQAQYNRGTTAQGTQVASTSQGATGIGSVTR